MQQSDRSSENRSGLVPKVLLTDTNRWAHTARIAIALAKEGCSVSGICPTRGHPLLRTRSVRRTFAYSGLRPLESLVVAIDATEPDMIIPCDDRGVKHLHELHQSARSWGASGTGLVSLIEHSLGSPESYPIVSARSDLIRIACEEGVRVPDTKPIQNVDDLKSWQAGHPLPWVLKGDGTFGGKGVRVVRAAAEAERCFLEIAGMYGAKRAVKRAVLNRDSFWLRLWWNGVRPAVVAQSHIQGRPANCAVVCWQGKVLAGIGVEVVSSIGSTGPATVVRVVDNPEMMHSAELIARRLNLSGFFGLDFMIEDGSDIPYLIEMNPRCTPLCHLQLGEGRDMVGALRAQLTGQPLQATPPVTLNDLIAYFPPVTQSDLIVHFPQAIRSKGSQASFEDVPQGEPELVQDLLRPWPESGLVYRLASKATDLAAAVANRKSGQGPAVA